MPTAKLRLDEVFVTYATDILGDTQLGLTANEIERAMRQHAVEKGVEIPHPTYPPDARNKRTVLAENILAFDERGRYAILIDLCDHRKIRERNEAAAQNLKLQIMAKYGHLAATSLAGDVNRELIEQTQHWLAAFPEVLELYNEALQKYHARAFRRNLLDDLRLALEKLLQPLLGNSRSLENQFSGLGVFVKEHGGSTELSNMFVKLVEYYSKYQNTYVKHNSAVIEEEVEFVLEITSAFMKHLIRLAGAA
jgi:hypothetical protein